MKQLKFNSAKDMKELEKYGYTRCGGTEKEHYHYGYYQKIIGIFNLKCIFIPFRDEHKGQVFIDYYDEYRKCHKMGCERPRLKRRYVKDLIKANLLIVEEKDE